MFKSKLARRRQKSKRRKFQSPSLDFSALEQRRLLACTPGGSDNNDQFCEAIRLHSGQFLGNTISTSTDVDLFEIRTGLAAGISLDFSFGVEATNGSGLDSFLRLFDSDGNPVLDGSGNPVEDDDSVGLNPRIDVTLPEPGTYYLGVSAFTNTNYNAETGTGDTSSPISTTTGSYLIVATDNNDEIGEALPILIGQNRSGFGIRHVFDIDMFEIDISGGPNANLDFTIDVEATDQSSSGLDAYLRIFDASGTPIDSDDDTFGSDDPSIDITFPSNGTYYIGVSASGNEDYNANTGGNTEEGNSVGGYTLKVSDNNDEISEAIPLALGQTRSGFSINHNADVDLFEFDAIGGGQRVRFEVIASNGLDSTLRIFSSNGSQFAGDTSGTDSIHTVIFSFAQPNYLGVSSSGNESYDIDDGSGDTAGTTTGNFSITATEVSRTTDNDQISEAIDLGQLGDDVLDRQNSLDFDVDVHMYEFEVVNDTFVHIDIDLTFPVTGLNSYLRLFDSAGNELAESDNDNSPEENALFPRDSYIGRFLTAGTYYVGVSGSGNEEYSPITGIGDAIGGVGSGLYQLDIFDGLRVNSTLFDASPAENQVTLEEAIDLADSLDGPNTIRFKSSIETLTPNETILISTPLTLEGHGANNLTISGGTAAGDDHRVFDITNSAGSLIDVTISGLTISDGGNGTVDLVGAGIRNTENLTLVGVSVESNDGGGSSGGGLHHSLGTLKVSDSTFTANEGHQGGAIFVGDGTAVIVNSTLSGNVSSDNALLSNISSTTTVRNSTITGNTGGGIFGFSGTLEMHNSIVAGNGGTDVGSSSFSGNSSFNLIGFKSNFSDLLDGTNGNIVGVNGNSTPRIPIATILDPILKFNGGPTKTHALVGGSRAINAGSDSRAVDADGNALTTDQRGSARIQGATGQTAKVDIGAYESDFEESSLQVSTISDSVDPSDGVTSLREAIAIANANDNHLGSNAVTDFIFFSSFGEIVLSAARGELEITESLVIQGGGANFITVNGGTGSNRVFRIDDGNDSELIDVTFLGMTISGGGDGVVSREGAGILNRENLTLVDVSVEENNGGPRGSGGGGLSHLLGTLTVDNSSFVGNQAIQGGGIFIFSGTASIDNTTFSGNSSSTFGGGLLAIGSTIVRNSTFTGNRADANGDGNGFAGGVSANSGQLTLHNSIVAGNFRGTGTSPSDLDSASLVVGSSNNLIGSAVGTQGGLTDGVDGNIIGINNSGTIPTVSILDTTLGSNGGQTRTHALVFGSPAVNAGDNSKAPGPVPGQSSATDQRGFGFARRKLGTVDIGAYESDFETRSLNVSANHELVDSTDGEISLQEAIDFANDDSAGLAATGDADNDGSAVDTITFDASLSGQTITVTSELPVTDSISIVGPGADQLSISGGDTTRILKLGSSASAATFTIAGITLVDGNAGTATGGAIELNDADDTLIVDGVNFFSNASNGGGAAFIVGADYTIKNSSFVENTANFSGSGILAFESDGLIFNSTFSGNVSNNGSGAIFLQTAGTATASLDIRNSTIAFNTGIGIQAFSSSGSVATLEIGNSIVSNNTGVNAFAGGDAVVQSNGFNISDDGSGVFNSTGDMQNTDPLLGALGLNGGTTFTHGINFGSPAVDAGDNTQATDENGSPLTTDQRGEARFRDGDNNGVDTVDIGAFEYLAVAGPTIESVVINGGDVQRSMVRELTISFSEIVNVDSSSFMLENLDTGVCIVPDVTTQDVAGKTVATLTFSGAGITGGSLADGNYKLTTLDTITDTSGNRLDGNGDGFAGDNQTDEFFRLYGDTNASRSVTILDLLQFRNAFGPSGGNNNPDFDYGGDGQVTVLDLLQFRNRFGTSI